MGDTSADGIESSFGLMVPSQLPSQLLSLAFSADACKLVCICRHMAVRLSVPGRLRMDAAISCSPDRPNPRAGELPLHARRSRGQPRQLPHRIAGARPRRSRHTLMRACAAALCPRPPDVARAGRSLPRASSTRLPSAGSAAAAAFSAARHRRPGPPTSHDSKRRGHGLVIMHRAQIDASHREP
jgi:hypothetical protein